MMSLDDNLECKSVVKRLCAQDPLGMAAKFSQLAADNAALHLTVQQYNSALDAMTARYVVLEALVTALPVLDMRFDSVAVGPLGWTVGGVTFGKVTEANAYSALLQYRATLAAKDAGKEVGNGNS